MYAQQQIRSMTVALALGIGLLAAPVQAQETFKPAPAPVKDHLKCYEVEPEWSNSHEQFAPRKKQYVELKTNLSVEACWVDTQPDTFCTSASKWPNHAPWLGGEHAGDFLCHELSGCYDIKGTRTPRVIYVKDQFSGKHPFKLKLKHADELCAPAERERGGFPGGPK